MMVDNDDDDNYDDDVDNDEGSTCTLRVFVDANLLARLDIQYVDHPQVVFIVFDIFLDRAVDTFQMI